jgi:hypothetical protein
MPGFSNMTDDELMLNMRAICIQLRGQILHLYTDIEFLIDKIISANGDLSFYMDIFEIKNFNTKVKSKIFKYCLEKYDTDFTKDTKEIRDKIDNITDKRHKFAHWMLDTTPIGIENFKKNEVIGLIKPDNSEKLEQFKQDTFNNLQFNTCDLRNKLIEILNILTQSNKI